MWVLILNCEIAEKPPAVIGGYPTREEAENAGDLATSFDPSWLMPPPYWYSYTVIPGAGCGAPTGMTHSSIVMGDGIRVRETRRFGK